MPKYRCIVAIPTRELFNGAVDYANVPGAEGDFGVLNGHESFVGLNRAGVLKLWLDPEGTEEKRFLISGGCTQVLNDHLAVLPRYGCPLDEIDVDAVRQEIEDIKSQIEEVTREEDKSDDAVLETLEARMAWCETQLNAKEGGVL